MAAPLPLRSDFDAYTLRAVRHADHATRHRLVGCWRWRRSTRAGRAAKATNISVLAAIGVRRDGQKILLSIRRMGSESTAAWRQFLDDLDAAA